jgi:hypothetical protein
VPVPLYVLGPENLPLGAYQVVDAESSFVPAARQHVPSIGPRSTLGFIWTRSVDSERASTSRTNASGAVGEPVRLVVAVVGEAECEPARSKSTLRRFSYMKGGNGCRNARI